MSRVQRSIFLKSSSGTQLPPDFSIVTRAISSTLVLEEDARDFSTGGGNSALIVTTKSPQRRGAPISGLPQRRQ
jgi:hypothetical protein